MARVAPEQQEWRFNGESGASTAGMVLRWRKWCFDGGNGGSAIGRKLRALFVQQTARAQEPAFYSLRINHCSAYLGRLLFVHLIVLHLIVLLVFIAYKKWSIANFLQFLQHVLDGARACTRQVPVRGACHKEVHADVKRFELFVIHIGQFCSSRLQSQKSG